MRDSLDPRHTTAGLTTRVLKQKHYINQYAAREATQMLPQKSSSVR